MLVLNEAANRCAVQNVQEDHYAALHSELVRNAPVAVLRSGLALNVHERVLNALANHVAALNEAARCCVLVATDVTKNRRLFLDARDVPRYHSPLAGDSAPV